MDLDMDIDIDLDMDKNTDIYTEIDMGSLNRQ
jgi:hypothetical protein